MSDSTLLQSFGPEDLATGIMPDLPNANPRLFVDGQNVYFEGGVVRPLLGEQLFLASAGTGQPTGILDTLVDFVPHVFWGTSGYLYSWTQADGRVERGSGFTTLNQPVWNFARWGNFVLATNGVDKPQVRLFDDFGPMSASAPDRAEILVERSPHVLAFNTDMGGEFFEWCDRDDIDTWTVTATNQAGNLAVRNLSSAFKAALKFRGEVVAFTTNEMVLVNYVGAPFVFGHKVILSGLGVWGKHSVCEVNGTLYGMGPRGIWKTDGSSVQYFDSPVVRDYITSSINGLAAFRTVAFYDRVRNLVCFFYPIGSSTFPNRGVAIDPRTGAWTLLSYGRTAATDHGIFTFSLVTGSNGRLYQISNIESVESGQDNVFNCWVETKDLDLGTRELKRVDGLLLELEGAEDIVGGTVQIGTRERRKDPIVWSATQDLASADGMFWWDLPDSRFFRLRIQDPSANTEWKLSRVDFYGQALSGDL